MPRTCTLCSHANRLQIEQCLVSGKSYRHIASHYGTSTAAVARHREHVIESLKKTTAVRESVRTGTLLDGVRAMEQRSEGLYRKAQDILAAALQTGDQRMALQAIRAAVAVMDSGRGALELRGLLTNELGRDRMSSTSMSIQIVMPDVGGVPQFRFVSDTIVNEDGFEEIGLVQGR